MIDDLLRCLGAGVLSENVTSLGCEIVHGEEERMWPVLAAVKLQTSRSLEPGILMGSPDVSTARRRRMWPVLAAVKLQTSRSLEMLIRQ